MVSDELRRPNPGANSVPRLRSENPGCIEVLAEDEATTSTKVTTGLTSTYHSATR
jgi:hypothetical protein